jgi:hypothetical protein
MTSTTPVPADTRVRYHGSVTPAHGYATVLGSIPDHDGKSADGFRYALVLPEPVTVEGWAGSRLTNVRRQSFTLPLEDAEDVLADCARLLDEMFDPWKATPADVPQDVADVWGNLAEVLANPAAIPAE